MVDIDVQWLRLGNEKKEERKKERKKKGETIGRKHTSLPYYIGWP